MNIPTTENRQDLTNKEIPGSNIPALAKSVKERLTAIQSDGDQSNAISIRAWDREQDERFQALPKLKDEGFFDVCLNPVALYILLIEMGFTDDQIQSIAIKFAAAQIPDRDFYGSVAGGITTPEGDIVVYSSIPNTASDQPKRALQRNNWYNLMLKPEVILESLLHELRHTWQIVVAHQPPQASFAASEHDDLNSERDAIAFGQQITPLLLEYFSATQLHHGLSATHDIKVDTVLDNLVDLGPGSVHIASDKVSAFFDWYTAELKKAESGIITPEEVAHYCHEVNTKLNNDQIGFAEWRYLLQQIQNKLKQTQPTLIEYTDAQLHRFDQDVTDQN